MLLTVGAAIGQKMGVVCPFTCNFCAAFIVCTFAHTFTKETEATARGL